MIDYSRATTCSMEEAEELFTFQPWNPTQISAGKEVRLTLQRAFRTVITFAPPSPIRTRALNAIIDARMLANAAITFDGKL